MAKKDIGFIVQPELMRDFQDVYGLIQSHRRRVAATVDNEGLMMLWEVSGYVSFKLKSSAWGDGVVSQLSEYIRTQDSTSRGWSYRTIYKMVQLYEMYSRPKFGALVSRMQMEGVARPQISTSGGGEIVPIEMAQIPSVLFATGWTNHQIIMSRCREAVLYAVCQ